MVTQSINDGVRLIGCGPRLAVVHGGPGFDHHYMAEALGWLSSQFELAFFDQIGSGSSRTPEGGATLEATALHVANVLNSLSNDRPIKVIAHSWGALVLAAAVCGDHGSTLRSGIKGGLLINPLPFERKAYDNAYAAFVSRVPTPIRQQAEAVAATTGDGATVMRILWPYYSAVASLPPPASFPLNLVTYASVMAKLGPFDFSAAHGFLARLSVLVGAEDFSRPFLSQDLVKGCRRFEELAGVGHFPMQEKSEMWRAAILQLLGDISCDAMD